MMNGIVWWVIAGLLVSFELFSGTFYLLMIALGLAAGGLAAWLGFSTALQFIFAAVVGMAATYALRKSKLGKFSQTDAAQDPNVNLDIGESLVIDEWKNNPGEKYTARVMYRGAMWDVQLAPGASAQPGSFIIHEIQGSRLIVSNYVTHNP